MVLTGNERQGDESFYERRGKTREDEGTFHLSFLPLIFHYFDALKIKYPDFLFTVSQFPNKLSSFAFVLGAPCFF